MAGSTSCASSSSSSSSFAAFTPRKYDVFISFRGEDTRRNFTCHLDAALRKRSIKPYIDYEINRGDHISHALLKAIQDSYVSVVVFSENYADSKWCLEELTKILECRKDQGQVVIPVFYNIDPTVVRKQTGSYEKAFKKYERDSIQDVQKVQEWKDALTEAANLAGCVSHSYGDDSELIQNIVEDVLSKLDYNYPPNELKGLVGLDQNCSPLESLSGEDQTVGIWGMGGIGKTTIAKTLFDKYSSQYDGCCFLENVRERSGVHGQGLLDLRNKLHSELLPEKIRQDNPADSTFVQNRLRRQKNFIVLDDVSTPRQFKYLVEELQCYGPGSRIIITTRDKNVLECARVEKIHEVKELDFQKSLRLFCLNAFNKDDPQTGYEELSKRAVVYSTGVPLALIVLGSFLHSKSEKEWESALRKLEKIPNEEIQNVLKLSYDGLDDEGKEIFLDIACFLKGNHIELVTSFLDGCGFDPVIGIKLLRDKALISMHGECVTMHDLIQGMGWEIIRRECTKNPEKRSRLWNFNDTCDVLKNNKGTDAIEGIMLDMSQSREHLHLSADTFKKMTNLRFIKINTSSFGTSCNLYFPVGLETFPDRLRYLEWHQCPLQSLPLNFCLEQLVHLRMPGSQFEKLWARKQNLVNLKEVDLRGCEKLMELPDFSKAQNIEKLDLSYCTSLRHVRFELSHNLVNLKEVDLAGCEKLMELPNFSKAQNIERLDLSYCTNLRHVRFELSQNLVNLKELDLTGCEKLMELPDFSKAQNIERLDLPYCTSLRHVPFELSQNLVNLKEVNLTGCEKLEELPDFSKAQNLKRLDLLFCDSLRHVHSSHLPHDTLEELTLAYCVKLESLEICIKSLRHLNVEGCSSLRKFSVSSEEIETLDLSGAQVEATLHWSIGRLSKGREIRLDGIRLGNLPKELSRLSTLKELSLSGCGPLIDKRKLHDIFDGLSSLRRLYLKECCNLHELPDNICLLSSLEKLILDYSSVVSLPASIKYLPRLEMLSLIGCTMLQSVPELPPSITCVTDSDDDDNVTDSDDDDPYGRLNYDWSIKECGVYPLHPSDNHNVLKKMELGIGH